LDDGETPYFVDAAEPDRQPQLIPELHSDPIVPFSELAAVRTKDRKKKSRGLSKPAGDCRGPFETEAGLSDACEWMLSVDNRTVGAML
jgi:hypothetical protein